MPVEAACASACSAVNAVPSAPAAVEEVTAGRGRAYAVACPVPTARSASRTVVVNARGRARRFWVDEDTSGIAFTSGGPLAPVSRHRRRVAAPAPDVWCESHEALSGLVLFCRVAMAKLCASLAIPCDQCWERLRLRGAAPAFAMATRQFPLQVRALSVLARSQR
jgi:hypothetical protein